MWYMAQKKIGIAGFFRLLVLTNLFLSIVSGILPFFEDSWLSEVEKRLRDFDGHGALLRYTGIFSFIIAVITITVGIICLVGLLVFNKSARLLFVFLDAWSVLYQYFAGVRVLVAYDAMLYGVISILDGVILAMAYFSPVNRRFRGLRDLSQ